MSSVKPYDGSGEVDTTEESAGAFIVSGCNGAVLLDFLKEILDEMPPFIHLFVVFALFDPVGFRRYDGLNLGLFQQIKDTLVRIIGLISQEGFYAHQKIGQQSVGTLQIVGLSGRQMKAGRIAQSIAGGMDFGRQSAL